MSQKDRTGTGTRDDDVQAIKISDSIVEDELESVNDFESKIERQNSIEVDLQSFNNSVEKFRSNLETVKSWNSNKRAIDDMKKINDQ